MYNELFWLVVVFVPLLFLTYWQVAFSPLSKDDLWAGLAPKTAAMSGVPTVAAMFYMTFVWIWPPDNATLYGVPYESNRHLVLLAYAALLGGAMLWSPFAQMALYREERRGYVNFVTVLVALSSVGLFVHTLAWSGDNQAWMIFAASVSMIHLVVIDGWVWRASFQVPETTPIFSVGPDNSFRPLRFAPDTRA